MMGLANNLMAVQAADSLNSHYGRLSRSLQRLSSGLRVNSAADDAAGLAIRELMRSDIAALHQGMRNANDAISMIQVADAALGIIDEKLIRMKELAEQAPTGTYDSTQCLMIDSEFQAMGAEIDRIANATDFNGIKLLDGSLQGNHDGSGLAAKGQMKIHFGTANDSAEDYYYMAIDDCSTSGLGLRNRIPFPDAPPGVEWINEAQIDYVGRHIILDITDGVAGVGASAFMEGLDYYALPEGLKNVTMTSNATRSPWHKPHMCLFNANGAQYMGVPISQTLWTFDTNSGQNSAKTEHWWNNVTPQEFLQMAKDKGVFHPWINMVFATPELNALNQPGGSNGALSTPTGINEKGSTMGGGSGALTDEIYELTEVKSDFVFFIGGHNSPLYDCHRYRLRIEADITDTFLQKLQFWAGDETAAAYGGMLSIETQEKAQKALVSIDDAIVRKDEIRAHLGAMQNRLENTVTTLSMQGENLQASESRISDADIAFEMTEFVRSQVLSQSALAMLGQANSFPHMLMTLLS